MNLQILDTGYYSKSNITTGGRAEVADRAGYDGTSGVTALTLRVKKITRNAGAGVDDAPSPSTYEQPEVNFVSFEGAKYIIECSIPKILAGKSSLDGNTYQYNYLTQIARLERTKGVKVIYPSAELDTVKTEIELLGAYNGVNGLLQGSGKPLPVGTNYISGRVRIVSALADAAKPKHFTFKIEFDAEEDIQD